MTLKIFVWGTQFLLCCCIYGLEICWSHLKSKRHDDSNLPWSIQKFPCKPRILTNWPAWFILRSIRNNSLVTWVLKAHPISQKNQRFRFSHIFLRCDLDHPTNFQNPPIRAFRDNIILLFSNGVDFHPALHFQEVFGGFWQISLNWSLYVKNWKKSFLRPLFRATFPLNTDLNSSSGSLWDPLEPSGTPLGTPLGGPIGSQRRN